MGQNAIPINSFLKIPAGTQTVQRGDVQGASYVAQRHGEQYEAGYNGGVGMAANSAGVTTSVALATTYVGICLSNPAASGVNLSLLRASCQLNVAPAALTAVGLIAGFSAAGVVTHTTPLTVESSIIGGSAAGLKGLVDSACTIVGTPFWADWLGETPAATSVGSFSRDYHGAILIPPGGYVAIGTLIASSANGFLGSLLWEENPV